MKIFLGYPSEHEPAAREVYEFLKARGDDVWFDKVSIVGGTEWDKERERGQQEADLIVHLCSEAILKRSGPVNREIRLTLRLVEDQPLGALYVIPIRLEPIKLPVELTRFQYFDFDAHWKSHLIEAVEKRRSQLSGRETASPVTLDATSESGTQRIHVEDLSESYECRGELLRYVDDRPYWQYINYAVGSEVLRDFYRIRGEFKRAVTEHAAIRRVDRKDEWSVSSEEFFRDRDLLSVRFYRYAHFIHAAHPNHYLRTLNFLGEDVGLIEIQELLGYSSAAVRTILAHCDDVLTAELRENSSRGSFFQAYLKDEERTWKLLSQFSFDAGGLTFNFSPYDVLPHVYGLHTVEVSWPFVQKFVAIEYWDLLKGMRGFKY